MKKILIVFCVLVMAISSNTFAQKAHCDTCWKKGNFAALNFNQASFSNWSAGGENSIGLTALLSSYAGYKNSDATTVWDNTADLAYGFLKSGSQELRKNEDKIDLTTKYGKKAFKKVYYTGLLNFKSQFAPGYNYPNDSVPVSKFLAPGYAIVSLGLEWRPKDYFSIYFSPATGKFTFVLDQPIADAGTYGNEPAKYSIDTAGNITKLKDGENIREEFGAYIVVKFQKDIAKNINLKSKLDLFDNYTDKNTSNRKNIDVLWENALVMKISKYISATILTSLIYDNDIDYINKDAINEGPKVQFKETLGIGFSAKF